MKVHIAFACSKAPASAKNETLADMDADNESAEGEYTEETAPLKKHKLGLGKSQQNMTKYIHVGNFSKEMSVSLDRELVRFIVGCNIPFKVADSPFFKQFIHTLQPRYKAPSATRISDSLFWDEAARVTRKTMTEIKQNRNLTIALDGWTDRGKSLYAFNVMTSDRRVYLYALLDFSEEKHTADFLGVETLKIIEAIGVERIAAIVTDNAANMRKLRQKVHEKYKTIVDLRCMPHYVNLITQDIMQHPWAKDVLKTSQSVVTYFGSHSRHRAKLVNCRSAGVPELKGYVTTRWYSAGNCIQSVLKNEEALRKLVQSTDVLSPDVDLQVSAEIRSIAFNRQYWADCELLLKILSPLMTIVGKLEAKTATIADCYLQVLSLAAIITENTAGPQDFRSHCITKFTRRWNELDDVVHLLAYFLNPATRGKGMSASLFPAIAETAASMWKDQGAGKTSTLRLLSQLMKFKNGEKPYDMPFSSDFMTQVLWWHSIEDSCGSELKTVALKLLSITPHSAACERTFSVLGWIHSKARNRLLVPRLEAIAKMYLYNLSHGDTDTNMLDSRSSHTASSSTVTSASTTDDADDMELDWDCYSGEDLQNDGFPDTADTEMVSDSSLLKFLF
jgi:hypothetical protein